MIRQFFYLNSIIQIVAWQWPFKTTRVETESFPLLPEAPAPPVILWHGFFDSCCNNIDSFHGWTTFPKDLLNFFLRDWSAEENHFCSTMMTFMGKRPTGAIANLLKNTLPKNTHIHSICQKRKYNIFTKQYSCAVARDQWSSIGRKVFHYWPKVGVFFDSISCIFAMVGLQIRT